MATALRARWDQGFTSDQGADLAAAENCPAGAASAMIVDLILAYVIVIYATGCAATVFELRHQTLAGQVPSARLLSSRYPRVAILANIVMIAFWPIFFTWWLVRQGWR